MLKIIKDLAMMIPPVRDLRVARNDLLLHRNALRADNQALRAENEALRAENEMLRAENETLPVEKDVALSSLNETLKNFDKLRFEKEAFCAENMVLRGQILAIQSTTNSPSTAAPTQNKVLSQDVRVAYVTMVKNSEKLIYHHLYYYRNIGITDFYICDNGSTDRTRELIAQFRSENPDLRVIVLADPTVGYYQAKRMTALTTLAFEYGCNWILPVDDDEILMSHEGPLNLPQFIRTRLASVIDGGFLHIPRFNYVPMNSDDDAIDNPFLRIRHREVTSSKPNQTVLTKWKNGMRLAQGNHEVSGEVTNIDTGSHPLFIAHFPYLDPNQVKAKIIQGFLAYQAAPDLYPTAGMHWKWHYERYKKIGDVAFAEIFAEWRDGAGELSAAPLVESMFQSRGAGANSEEFKDQQCGSSHSLPAVPTAALTKL